MIILEKHCLALLLASNTIHPWMLTILQICERVLGHGGSQVYYDDSVVTDKQVDELYSELGEIEIARVRREQREAFFSNLQELIRRANGNQRRAAFSDLHF